MYNTLLQKIDVLIIPTEIDSYPVKIGDFSPVVSQHNIFILSFNKIAQARVVDVFSDSNIFQPTSFSMLVIVFFISIVLNKLLRCRKSKNNIPNLTWFVLSSFLQGHGNMRRIPSILLSITITMFIIRQLFLSLISTNLIVTNQEFRIDTFDNLLDPRAADIHPFIFSSKILKDWIQTSNELEAVKLRNHFNKFKNVFYHDNKKMEEEFREYLLNKKPFSFISRKYAIDSTVFTFCDKENYNALTKIINNKINPYVSKNSYFPVCHAFLFNIKNETCKLRFIDL